MSANFHELLMDGVLAFPDMVRQCIGQGARLDAHDRSGNTPLHKAAYRGYSRTAVVLLRSGADWTAKNRYGQTPLDVARIRDNADTASAMACWIDASQRSSSLRMSLNNSDESVSPGL